METSQNTIPKEMLQKLLDAEKLKYCFECGICTSSCSMAEMLGADYNPRSLLEKIFLNPEATLASDELWLCGWCYRCHKNCPQGLKLPEIFLSLRAFALEHGYTEPVEIALQKMVDNLPLPLVTTLVCLHPERAGLDKDKVLTRIRELRKDAKAPRRKKSAKSSEERVAILGSGPAGLTVAYELAQKGHIVTVFDALPESGGMLRKCIPEYRLPKQILAEEIRSITDMGVELKNGVIIGKDVSLDDLWKDGYKAIFIALGAHKSQKLRMDGENLKGVVDAIDFLRNVNFGEDAEIGKKVVVIGGGNVAVDAARTALHNSAEEVIVLYRRSREEMPANLWEVKEAEEEGVKFELLVAPKRILGENGHVSALECIRMQLGEPDESGRRKPIPTKDSEFTRQVDTVILAIGETSDLSFLSKDMMLNEDGTVWVNPVTLETSVKGIFAGGDVVTGSASVIEAIRDGKKAAISIENYLKSIRG